MSILAHAGIETSQSGFLVARNDYHSVKVPVSLVITGAGLAGWAIALIVIGSLLGAAAIGFLIFVFVIKKKTPNR